MIPCSAKSCPSSQTTKINGRPISFYAFPKDSLRKNQWIHNCNLFSGIIDKEPMHLCELHFEGINFTASRDLKLGAVPTQFISVSEGPSQTQKSEDVLQTPPLKQRKLDESHTTAMLPENSSAQHMDNNSASGNKADVSINNMAAVNGSAMSTTDGNCEKNKEYYRLTIQIDKIRGKPGPRCKKLIPLLMLNNDMKDLATGELGIGKKSQSLQGSVKKACTQGSCKIRKCMNNSKLAFQCEICKKCYVGTRKQDGQDDKRNMAYATSPDSRSSNVHVKKNFICDICQTESNTQLMYDKHVKHHVSTDPLYPYKCHLCVKIFELKEDVKQHCLNEHLKLKIVNTLRPITSPIKIAARHTHQCTSCNITFSNEQAYRNHINSHKKKESLRAHINEPNSPIFPVQNPLTGSQIGILQPIKFSCTVCSKQFDNVGEVDAHTRTHLEDAKDTKEVKDSKEVKDVKDAKDVKDNKDVKDDKDVKDIKSFKCNICKKIYKNNAMYNEHLKQHLSRAYSCSICLKAFINKTTLKIHQKTHGET